MKMETVEQQPSMKALSISAGFLLMHEKTILLWVKRGAQAATLTGKPILITYAAKEVDSK